MEMRRNRSLKILAKTEFAAKVFSQRKTSQVLNGWRRRRIVGGFLWCSIYLSFSLSVCLSTNAYLSIHLFAYLPTCSSIYIFICHFCLLSYLLIYQSFTYLPIYLSLSLHTYISTYLNIYLSISQSAYLYIYLSIHLPIDLSIYLPIYLSISLTIWTSMLQRHTVWNELMMKLKKKTL